jgi:hypothetical protein
LCDATCSTLEDPTRDPSRAAAARSAGRGERHFPGRHRPNEGRAIRPFVAPERHRPRTVHAGGDRRSRPGTGSPRQSTTVGSERAEVHAAERRKDMQTQRLPLARECRGTQTWPDDVLEPVFCEAFEVHDSTARGRPALVFAIRPPAGQQRPFGSCRTQTGARGFRPVARHSTWLSSARPRVGRSSPHVRALVHVNASCSVKRSTSA